MKNDRHAKLAGMPDGWHFEEIMRTGGRDAGKPHFVWSNSEGRKFRSRKQAFIFLNLEDPFAASQGRVKHYPVSRFPCNFNVTKEHIQAAATAKGITIGDRDAKVWREIVDYIEAEEGCNVEIKCSKTMKLFYVKSTWFGFPEDYRPTRHVAELSGIKDKHGGSQICPHGQQKIRREPSEPSATRLYLRRKLCQRTSIQAHTSYAADCNICVHMYTSDARMPNHFRCSSPPQEACAKSRRYAHTGGSSARARSAARYLYAHTGGRSSRARSVADDRRKEPQEPPRRHQTTARVVRAPQMRAVLRLQ